MLGERALEYWVEGARVDRWDEGKWVGGNGNMRGGRPSADLRQGRMWVEGRATVLCGKIEVGRKKELR